MIWTAVVPLKLGPDRKSRLAGTLDPAGRAALADRMAIHVLVTLHAAPSIGRVLMVAPALPGWARAEWIQDRGRGLNAELAAVADGISSPLVVVHADLPFVGVDDVEALTASAEGNAAIAPDRHDGGTNALAIAVHRPGGFPLAFGAGSFGRHMASRPDMAVVRRPGLATDIDTPADLRLAIEQGFDFRL